MTAQQIRLLIALFLLSSTVNAAYADSDGFSVRTHPRDIFRRVGDEPPSTPPRPATPSIEDHTKQHLSQNPLTTVRGNNAVAASLRDRPNERHRQDTFHGSVPVQGGASSLSPGTLNKYAKGGYESADLHAPERQGDNHVMGAAHRTGSDTVHLHSNPKGSSLFKPYAVKGAGQFGAHAETAAVSTGIAKEGSASGWSVGQHGHFSNGDPVKEPCKGCQTALTKADVTHQKADGTIVHPHTPVGGSSAQAAPAAHQNAPTGEKRKASKSPSGSPGKDKPVTNKKKL